MPLGLWIPATLLADVLLAPHLSLFGARPDITVAALTLVGIQRHAEGEGILRAWAVGFGRDLLSADPLGVHAFSFMMVAWGTGWIRRSWFVNHPATRALLVATGVAAQLWLSAGLTWLATADVSLPRAGLTGVVAGLWSGALVVLWAGLFPGVLWRLRNASSRPAWS